MIVFFNKAISGERPHISEIRALVRYKFASQFIKDKEVLDIGTGLGSGAYYLASNGARMVVGIDYSKSAVDYAKKSFVLPNLEFSIMNAENLTFPTNSFDVIIVFEFIEHMLPEYYTNFLNNIKRILKTGGYCLLSTPNKLISSPSRTKPYNPYHIKEFEPRELIDLLKKYFPKVLLQGFSCINKDYLEQRKNMHQSIRYRILSFFGQYKLIRKLLAYIPKILKQKVTSENKLPQLQSYDFEVFSDDINNCEYLIGICRKDA